MRKGSVHHPCTRHSPHCLVVVIAIKKHWQNLVISSLYSWWQIRPRFSSRTDKQQARWPLRPRPILICWKIKKMVMYKIDRFFFTSIWTIFMFNSTIFMSILNYFFVHLNYLYVHLNYFYVHLNYFLFIWTIFMFIWTIFMFIWTIFLLI